MESGRDERRRRAKDEIAEDRPPHRQRLDSGQAVSARVGDGEGVGELVAIAKHGVAIDDRLEPRRRLALIGLLVAADAEGGGDRVEQPAAGRSLRSVDPFTAHRIQRRARPAGKIGEKLELGEIRRELGPAHLGHQMGVEIAPGLARGLRAAEHRDRLEQAEPAVGAIVREQELPAPDRSVVAPSQTVEDDSERGRAVEGMEIFGEAGGDMGVMMLDLDQRNRLRGGASARELGRKIFRVLVGDQRDGPMIEQLGVKGKRAAIVVERLGVLQIALVLRQDRLAVLDQAERRLELAAHRQQWRRGVKAARAARAGQGRIRARAGGGGACRPSRAPPNRRPD